MLFNDTPSGPLASEYSALIFLFGLLLSALPTFAASCAGDVSTDVVAKAIEARSRQFANPKLPPFSREEALAFLRQGWPRMKAIAEANHKKPFEIWEDAFVMLSLLTEATNPGFSKRFGFDFNSTKLAMESLDGINPERGPRNRRQWFRIEPVLRLFYELGYAIFHVDRLRGTPTKLNPTLKMDAAQVDRYLDAVEDLKLENVITVARSVRPAVVSRPPVPVAEENVDDQGPLALEQLAPIPVPADPVANASPEYSFNDLLKRRGRLEVDVVYQVINAEEKTYNITATTQLVKELQNESEHVVYRLLRAIVVGSARRSGLEMMPSLGPSIVRVSSVVHGHKYIFGCLQETNLRLKRLIDFNPDSGTYARRIPSDLCKD